MQIGEVDSGMERNSEIVVALLAGVAIVVVVVILALTVLSSHTFQARRPSPEAVLPTSQVSRVYSYSGFTGIAASGAWHVTIRQGTDAKVSVTVPAGLADAIDVSQEGSILHFAMKSGTVETAGRLLASVTMPDLTEVDASGATYLTFSGFKGGDLLVRCSGAAAAYGSESRFSRATISATGAADVGFRAAPTREAQVQVSGAGRVVLTIDGGHLSGNASGVSQVVYNGTASSVSVRTSGAARVVHAGTS